MFKTISVPPMSIRIIATFIVCFCVQALHHNGHIEFSRAHHVLSEDQMSKIVIGRSSFNDVNNLPYFFFVYPKELDAVSGIMKSSGGMWERQLNLMFQKLVEDERARVPLFVPNVIDIGVNFGAFTLFAASMKSNLWGFDIQAMLLTLVDMGLRVNEYKHYVKLFHVAVWDKPGLNFTFSPELLNFGGTTIVSEIAESRHPSKQEKYTISTKRIDSVYNSQDGEIFFLKMDCEGCEPRSFMGMDSLVVNRMVRHIVTEVSGDPAILEPLYHLGYTCRVFDDRQDCSFPKISDTCLMPTWEAAQRLFRVRRPYEHWDLYMDVHCELTGQPTVPIPDLKKSWDLERKYVHLTKEPNTVYLIKDGSRFEVTELPAGETAVEISYGKMYFFPLSL